MTYNAQRSFPRSRLVFHVWAVLGVSSALLHVTSCSSDGSGAAGGGGTGAGTGGLMSTGGGSGSAAGGSSTGGQGASSTTGGTSSSGGSGAVGGATSGGSGSGGAPTGGSSVGGEPTQGGSGGASSGASGGGGTGGGAGLPPEPDGFYVLEDLDRGLVAIQDAGGVYVGFRQLGYEHFEGEPERVRYELLRDGVKIADLTDSTNYFDADGQSGSAYSVVAHVDQFVLPETDRVTPWAQNYLTIPLSPPSSNNHPQDASAGDLDGDGQLDLVIKWEANNAQDNANGGVTSNVFIEGLRLDGTSLWRIDLGPNIRAGAHYTQFVVADFDGDGGAELAVKTGPGTRDSSGQFLSMGPAAGADHSAVYRNGDGYILSGPEYLTVFDGLTGEELATTNFDVARGNVGDWGDTYGNRVDRFLATAAYLDETGLPSFVMARGYYTRSTLTAWNFRDGELRQIWKFDGDQEQGGPWNGQGAHSLSVANVDSDLGQEIIYGAMTVDHDGKGMCSTGLNHGDALHVSDFLPSRPGVEVFMPHEYEARPLWSLRDGATCEIIRQGAISDSDVGRGVAADIDPGNPGAEFWASSGVGLTSAATGTVLSANPGLPINFLIWWDADESRELEDGTSVTKYGAPGALVSCGSCSSNNGTKSTPALVADLLGDWREEVIWRESNDNALRLYTTTDVTERRIHTLMHDPQYRVAISWQNVAYNQPPHPSFHIGQGMAEPPRPDISVR